MNAIVHNKRAVGVFTNHREAEDALNELRTASFPMTQVSIVAQDSEQLDRSNRIGDTNVHDLADSTHIDEGAKTGAATGGAVGGITGLLVGLGTLAIPGVGPIMLAGAAATALATAVAGTAIGAAAGSLVGSLVGLGIPEDRAQVYHDRVVGGEYLVIIDGVEAEVLQAETILKRHGIREWEVYTTPATTSGRNDSAAML
jgi:hypothetical protein